MRLKDNRCWLCSLALMLVMFPPLCCMQGKGGSKLYWGHLSAVLGKPLASMGYAEVKNSIQTSLRQTPLAWLCASVQWSAAESCYSWGQGSDGELAYHAPATLASRYRCWCCGEEHAIALALLGCIVHLLSFDHAGRVMWPAWFQRAERWHAWVMSSRGWVWRCSSFGISPPPPDSRWRYCFRGCLFFLDCYSCN